MASITDSELERISIEFGVQQLGNAFRDKAFVYGTTGKSRPVTISSNPPIHSSQQSWKPPVYYAGQRAATVDKDDLQMMDMYYGDGGSLTHKRNPVISSFVLAATGMTGFGNSKFANNKKISPRLAYIAKYGNAQEGWNRHDPGANDFGQTTTKEISRIIRWGIGQFGGTLIYEGAEVYYGDVFYTHRDPGDTAVEAQNLFQLFRPYNHTVQFGHGNGKVIFHWYGRVTVPTKLHFLSTWEWNHGANLINTIQVDKRNLSPELDEALFKLPEIDLNKKLDEIARKGFFVGDGKQMGGNLYDFWNNFAYKPDSFELQNQIIHAQKF